MQHIICRPAHYPPIDFGVLCPYWDLFEQDGLSENVLHLRDSIVSPVLVCGSGQGIVPHALIACGYHVTSVDKSPEMHAYAKKRRGIDTVLAPLDSHAICGSYATVIINTGIITSLSLQSGILDAINSLVRRVALPAATVLFSYFRHSAFIDHGERLRLYGCKSNNHLFWLGRHSQRVTYALFVSEGIKRSDIESFFQCHRVEATSHRRKIISIGNRYAEAYGKSPVEFIRSYAGFYPYNLRDQEETLFRNTLISYYDLLCENQINLNTNVIVCRSP